MSTPEKWKAAFEDLDALRLAYLSESGINVPAKQLGRAAACLDVAAGITRAMLRLAEVCEDRRFHIPRATPDHQ